MDTFAKECWDAFEDILQEVHFTPQGFFEEFVHSVIKQRVLEHTASDLDEPLSFNVLKSQGYPRNLQGEALIDLCDPQNRDVFPLFKRWCNGVSKCSYLAKYNRIPALSMTLLAKTERDRRVKEVANQMLQMLYEVS